MVHPPQAHTHTHTHTHTHSHSHSHSHSHTHTHTQRTARTVGPVVAVEQSAGVAGHTFAAGRGAVGCPLAIHRDRRAGVHATAHATRHDRVGCWHLRDGLEHEIIDGDASWCTRRTTGQAWSNAVSFHTTLRPRGLHRPHHNTHTLALAHARAHTHTHTGGVVAISESIARHRCRGEAS